MREHMGLFRGKIRIIDEWVEGSLLKYPDGDCYICRPSDDPAVLDKYDVDTDTVGECTGLRDKNGKLIFEGDIVDHHVQGNILVNRGVIVWDAKNGRWAHKLNTMEPCLFMFNSTAWEIIGNIHDNPELLEVGDDG